MYNVEIYNRSARKIVESKPVSTEREASKTARAFIARIKEKMKVTNESNFDISPCGYVIGQTLYTDDAIYDITTGKK